MPIEESIEDWNLDYIEDISHTVNYVLKEHRTKDEKYPIDVMAVGNNWIYIAHVEPMRPLEKPLEINGQEVFSGFSYSIVPPAKIGRYIPLKKILDDMRRFLPNDEMKLFPYTDQRNEEAKRLGQVYQNHDDLYAVMREDGKLITVFPIIPGIQVTYNGNIPVVSRKEQRPPMM